MSSILSTFISSFNPFSNNSGRSDSTGDTISTETNPTAMGLQSQQTSSPSTWRTRLSKAQSDFSDLKVSERMAKPGHLETLCLVSETGHLQTFTGFVLDHKHNGISQSPCEAVTEWTDGVLDTAVNDPKYKDFMSRSGIHNILGQKEGLLGDDRLQMMQEELHEALGRAIEQLKKTREMPACINSCNHSSVGELEDGLSDLAFNEESEVSDNARDSLGRFINTAQAVRTLSSHCL